MNVNTFSHENMKCDEVYENFKNQIRKLET
jgi:hypothetical protein